MRTDRECHHTRVDTKRYGNSYAAAVAFLPRLGPPVLEAGATFHLQITVPVQPHAARSRKCHSDGGWIRPRTKLKLKFEGAFPEMP